MNKPATADKTVTVLYSRGQYRIHASDCADVQRDVDNGYVPRLPTAGSLFDMAKEEYADLIAEDPECFDDETVLAAFESVTKILPCAQGRLRSTRRPSARRPPVRHSRRPGEAIPEFPRRSEFLKMTPPDFLSVETLLIPADIAAALAALGWTRPTPGAWHLGPCRVRHVSDLLPHVGGNWLLTYEDDEYRRVMLTGAELLTALKVMSEVAGHARTFGGSL
jgi:hypothetical protein